MDKKIGKSIVYNSLGSFIYLFCQWAVTFIVVWFSGYSSAGVLSVAMSITNTFAVISTFNMRNYQSSDLDGKFSEKVYIGTRVITIIIAVLVTLFYSLFKNFSFFEFLCINSYMIYKMTESIVDVLHGSLQKKWRFDIICISYIVRGILTISLFSLGLLLTHNLLFSIMLMSVGIYIFIFLYDVRCYLKEFSFSGKFNYKKMMSLLIGVVPLVLYGLLANYTAMQPRIFTSVNLGEKMLGYYASVATLALIIQVAASFVFNPLINIFASSYANKDFKKFYQSLFKVIVVIILLGFISILCVFWAANSF